MTDRADDATLVRRSLAGDERAFEELVARYEGPLFRLAWRFVRDVEEARDVVQEVFLRAFRALETFDLERRFATWIFRIATNLCIDRARKKVVRTVSIDASEQDDDRPPIQPQSSLPGPEDDLRRRDFARAVEASVAALPPLYRAIVELRYVQHLSYEKIAEVLGVPIGTVKARLHRAHRRMRESLERMGFGPESLEN